MEGVKVCTDLAPHIAGRLSRDQGWRVTRVGTRVRNPLLGMPDAWEQQVLALFAARAAKGEDKDGVLFSPMHGWAGRLSDQESWDVLSYIRSVVSFDPIG